MLQTTVLHSKERPLFLVSTHSVRVCCSACWSCCCCFGICLSWVDRFLAYTSTLAAKTNEHLARLRNETHWLSQLESQVMAILFLGSDSRSSMTFADSFDPFLSSRQQPHWGALWVLVCHSLAQLYLKWFFDACFDFCCLCALGYLFEILAYFYCCNVAYHLLIQKY